MNFLRAVLASILSLVCSVAVSAFVILQTLETTALDRTEVKGWVDKSGVYNNLLTTVLTTNTAAQQELNATGSSIVTSDDIKKALSLTFDSAYIKQSAEKTIDSAYNWLDGKSSSITFEINTTEKKDEFRTNLASVIEPQLAQLPQCMSVAQFRSNNPPCLPPGTTPQQAADELATDAANQASIFRQPVTNQTIAQTSGGSVQTDSPLVSEHSSSNKLRDFMNSLQMWLIWLPIIAIVSGGLMVLLSQHKLKAAKHLAGRMTVSLALTCAFGLVIANVGESYNFTKLTGANNATMSQILEPIIHQAAPAIGFRLAFVSGMIALGSFVAWMILLIVKRKRERADLLTAPADAPNPLTSPAESPQIPPKADKPSSTQPSDQKKT